MTDIARATIPALYALSNLRSPWFSWLMGMVTWLGDGVFFVVVGVICYWCWSSLFVVARCHEQSHCCDGKTE